jgi:hypothetical protein
MNSNSGTRESAHFKGEPKPGSLGIYAPIPSRDSMSVKGKIQTGKSDINDTPVTKMGSAKRQTDSSRRRAGRSVIPPDRLTRLDS